MNSLSIPEIDLYHLARTTWKRRIILFLVVGCLMLPMILILHLVPKQYTVSMSVAPITGGETQVGNGGLSALARLGGVNLSDISGGAGQFHLFVNALTSRTAADRLAHNQPLMQKLFPAQWSEKEKRWEEPSSILRLISHSLKGVLGIPVEPWHPPSGEQVHELLTNNLQVDDDPKSPIVVVSIQSATPEVAQELLLNLAKAVDAILRQRALDRANDYIGYLTGQLGKVTVADYRAALVQHLSEQEQTRMMASANVSFAAQMFGDPSRSATPTAPKSLLLLILALAGSVLVGAIVANVVEHRQQGGEK